MHSANEVKSIDISDYFRNEDELENNVEVLVKCCSWSSNGKTISVAAKSKLFVST